MSAARGLHRDRLIYRQLSSKGLIIGNVCGVRELRAINNSTQQLRTGFVEVGSTENLEDYTIMSCSSHIWNEH